MCPIPAFPTGVLVVFPSVARVAPERGWWPLPIESPGLGGQQACKAVVQARASTGNPARLLHSRVEVTYP